VNKVKLVDAAGIINPKAFYTYLTAWVSNDALAYYASQANFRPEPREWIHVPTDFELKIPKSQPLVYTQLPFFLNRMRSTEEITATIIEIRSICQKYEEKGLPNFPHGIPFTYWEQYVRLPLYLISAGIVVTALVFLVICLTLFSAWAASLIVVLEVAIVAQLYGLMGWFDIPLSALPAVILIISVGIGTVFFLPVTVVSLPSA
jgi:patched 1 protein